MADFCPNCGSPTEPLAKSCPKCTAALGSPVVSPSAEGATKSAATKVVLVFLGIVVALAVVGKMSWFRAPSVRSDNGKSITIETANGAVLVSNNAGAAGSSVAGPADPLAYPGATPTQYANLPTGGQGKGLRMEFYETTDAADKVAAF
jgi:hypothetical protein